MSGYSGRRGPNVSQFIANLNTIPSAQDLPPVEPPNMEDELALFTNTEFLDWDGGVDFDVNQPVDYDPEMEHRTRRMNASGMKNYHANTVIDETKSSSKEHQSYNDFINSTDFQFPDFNGFQNPMIDSAGLPSLRTSQQGSSYPPVPSYTSPVSNSVSPVTAQFDQSQAPSSSSVTKKRKLDNLVDHNSQHAIDEAARVAAEEDKRRRNTAASARFRVKKKQREQTLEKTAKEMTERVNVLESKITQLEMENSWLKGLITEKNDKTADLGAMFKKFTEEKIEKERSREKRNDGVGTGEKDEGKAD